MSGSFDPYHKWLGIPQKDQPPNHYRLLGIEVFETDREVIDAAANRVMSYLQDLSVGTDAAAAQRLLNEISAARLCLLTPQKKAAYDEVLREQRRAATPPFRAAPPGPAPMARPIGQPAPTARPIPPPQPVAPKPAAVQPTISQPAASPDPTSMPVFDASAAPVKSSGGGASILQNRKKDKSLTVWLVGGGLTTTILVVAIVFASMSQTGPGTISDEVKARNATKAEKNSLPALLIIKMRDKDRPGASITINGKKEVVPASGPIKYFLRGGMQHVVITHKDHATHDERLGIDPGKEFVLPIDW